MMAERGWTLTRAALLVAAAVLLSPISPVWLVLVPLALLLLAFRTEDWMSVAIAAVILGLGFAGSRPGGMEWYVPRAWSLIAGGTFVAVTAARGHTGLVGRALGAVGLALMAVLAVGAILWTYSLAQPARATVPATRGAANEVPCASIWRRRRDRVSTPPNGVALTTTAPSTAARARGSPRRANSS